MSDFKDLFNDWEPDLSEKEVTIANVVEEIYFPSGNAQGRADSSMWVLLRDAKGREFKIVMLRELGIAILSAIRGDTPDRPFTHDLMRNIIGKLGGSVEKVVIDDLWQDTFYAKIWLRVGERAMEVDARPSDAIALALRFQAPIFVSEAVLAVTQQQGEES